MASSSRYFCDVCNLKLISDKAMEEHLKGKKHQKVEEVTKMRQNQAEKSIFVGNLVKSMSEIEITDYFMKVGSVEKVIMDKEKHQYAIVEFESKELVQQALASKKHTIGGRKVNVKQREWKPYSKPKPPHKHPSAKSTPRGNADDAVIESIAAVDSVAEQMHGLLARLQLSPEDVSLRYLICRLLQSVFQEFMPHVSIAPYGSSVNSYGVKGCDLDLNLTIDSRSLMYQFSTPLAEDETLEKIDKTNLKEFNEGQMLDLTEDGDSATMEMICKIIRQLVPGMKNVRGIPLARKPVVKFCHSQSGLMCDISINNRLALRNTELVSFYGKLHPVVRPLVFTIRQWAKVKQIAGNVGAGPKLTNYALTLLIITYLQMEEVKVLPSVDELEAANENGEQIIDGWNCSFSLDVDVLKSVPKKQSIENLLIGFYKFYAMVDFSSNVICPRKGQIVPVHIFQKEASGLTNEFKFGSLNVQDPLELSHNVAGNVNEKTTKRLSGEIKVAQVVCQSKKFSKHDSEKRSWGLMLLLKEGAGGPLRTDVVGCLEVAFHDCSFSEGFRKKWEGNSDGAHNDWSHQMVAFFKMVLHDVLKFDCHVVSPLQKENTTLESSDSKDKHHSMEEMDINRSRAALKRDLEDDSPLPTKKIKIDKEIDNEVDCEKGWRDSETSFTSDPGCSSEVSSISPDGNDNHAADMDVQSTTSSAISLPGEHLLTCSCKVKFPVWIGRRKLRRILMKLPEFKSNILALESAVTSKVIKEQDLMGDVKFTSGSMGVQLHLRKVLENGDCRLMLQMVPVTEEAECKSFFHFFENFFSKLLSNHVFQ
ncbi:speckle targeted PIP5K1A-regulated poly(A) polymerase-like [Anneissia japonica]|uniref:speckle targeted PIP5K1A-regulated poly(A) polymerase-like n=1 Tax=Anneissia japonica TaxID=1529436 RepID=UPI0014259204|nr:speckle targeted PIP5K1A-regulated poly(A) polymerase-like [Anneissia japonica]XP_033124194.1 speckle targeted PIP5K1A-regulated poly(A) polymerase-like [Anneissia japonica]